jgi:hypothetical protein
MIPPLFGKQEVGIWWVQKRFPRYGVPSIHIEHICTFFVTFFSATIDGRDLIFGHKLHIGTPYRGKRFGPIRFLLPTNKMNCELILTYDTPALWQTGSRNLTGQKTLPTIWGTFMKLVTKYQISTINSCWEKCDEKWAYMFNVYKNQISLWYLQTLLALRCIWWLSLQWNWLIVYWDTLMNNWFPVNMKTTA